MTEGWILGLLANATISVAYLAVAALLAWNLTATRQWQANPLAVATVFLYVTCGGGHGIYALQLSDVALGFRTEAGLGARIMYGSWHMWSWDIVTAFVGIAYWTMRRRFRALVTGTAVFEDLRERQKRALEINDNVIQGLIRAKLAFDLGRDEEGRAAVSSSLAASSRIVEDLAPTPQPTPAQGGA